jgi:hypothetical protein
MRLADAYYGLDHHGRLAFVSKTSLNWITALEVPIDTQATSFLADAAQGTLPSVSRIDPNFCNPRHP